MAPHCSYNKLQILITSKAWRGRTPADFLGAAPPPTPLPPRWGLLLRALCTCGCFTTSWCLSLALQSQLKVTAPFLVGQRQTLFPSRGTIEERLLCLLTFFFSNRTGWGQSLPSRVDVLDRQLLRYMTQHQMTPTTEKAATGRKQVGLQLDTG